MRVLSHVADVNVAAVAASVATDRCLIFPPAQRPSAHCWHVGFLMQYHRTMTCATSSCERVGSLLHNLFTGDTRLAPARVAARLRLREAGLRCDGNQKDEELVADVAEFLTDAGKRPFLTESHQRKRKRSGVEASGSLRLTRARLARVVDAQASRENVLLQLPFNRVCVDREHLACAVRFTPAMQTHETIGNSCCVTLHSHRFYAGSKLRSIVHGNCRKS